MMRTVVASIENEEAESLEGIVVKNHDAEESSCSETMNESSSFLSSSEEDGEQPSERNISYYVSDDDAGPQEDAGDVQLQARIQVLTKENEKLRAERNAAMEDMQDVNELRSQINTLTFKNEKLRAERDTLNRMSPENKAEWADDERSMMHSLSEAVHSLDCASTENKDNEDNKKKELQLQVECLTREIEKLRTERGVTSQSPGRSEGEDAALTTERAMSSLMRKMKSKIEKLEEEQQKMTLDCQSNEITISSLQEDLDLKEAKVSMLEAMVKSLSQGGTVPTHPKWMLPWGDENKADVKLEEAKPSLRSRFSFARKALKKTVS
jgi:chromosome segregation ATPase